MAAVKNFVTANGYTLVGDSRDIAVAYKLRAEVWDWCSENNITVHYQGSLSGTDLWRVTDEEQRVIFALRWL
jgi:hypothetical protein